MHEPHFLMVLSITIVFYGLARLFVSVAWSITIACILTAILFPNTSLSLVLGLIFFGVMIWLFDGTDTRYSFKPKALPEEELLDPTSKYFNGFYYDYNLECKIKSLVAKGEVDKSTISELLSSEYSDCKQIKTDKDFDDFVDGYNKFVRE